MVATPKQGQVHVALTSQPNHSFELTFHGKPWPAAQLKR